MNRGKDEKGGGGGGEGWLVSGHIGEINTLILPKEPDPSRESFCLKIFNLLVLLFSF